MDNKGIWAKIYWKIKKTMIFVEETLLLGFKELIKLQTGTRIETWSIWSNWSCLTSYKRDQVGVFDVTDHVYIR